MHEELVFTQPAQFVLYGDGLPDPGEVPVVAGNGLVEVRRGAVMIFTGAQYKQVHVSVETLDEAPALPGSDWTEVVEVSFTVRNGVLRIGGVDLGPKGSSPNFAISDVDEYRVRFSARGRDDAWNYAEHGSEDEEESPILEYHLIEIWPAPPAPPQALRLTDRTGTSYRTGG
ncbi:hypothetical protein [Frankia sp. AiPa1]|uniref:hypothetical protein n=1 Tax=Frankia sp. AiPa1 TaxID=573492 RepID=UPI00202AEAD0|nr:hypothetical protein [Frankia sp. AiPa1]MCL9759416.1 hypothetical protein [Frankia sp. AiPa1]